MHIYYINGQFKHKEESFISVEDRGFNFSDGVYEVVSFNNFKIINKEKHFLRLKRSLSELNIENPFKLAAHMVYTQNQLLLVSN